VVRNAPLVSIDLVVTNARGQVLLGQRTNRPAQGYWFVPGGRILKNEPLDQAFLRLTQDELGRTLSMADAEFLGVYEHFYADNFSGEGFSTHYVVLGYRLHCDIDLDSLPADQHEHYRWWPIHTANNSKNVHANSKAYFMRATSN